MRESCARMYLAHAYKKVASPRQLHSNHLYAQGKTAHTERVGHEASRLSKGRRRGPSLFRRGAHSLRAPHRVALEQKVIYKMGSSRPSPLGSWAAFAGFYHGHMTVERLFNTRDRGLPRRRHEWHVLILLEIGW